jgi:hypothetical protein
MYAAFVNAAPLSSYTPDLSPEQLDRALESLCDSARRAEWLMCRYLADMTDGGHFRAVGWYSDVVHYGRKRFGFGVKSTRERVRIGRALRIEGSAEGSLTWYDRYGVEQGTEEPRREAISGLSEDAVEVLRAMGGRGGFTVDGLCRQRDVPVSKVMRGLGGLEATGKVRRGLIGDYSPVRAPGCEREPAEPPPTTQDEPKVAGADSPPPAESHHATTDEQLLPPLELEPSGSRDQVLRTMQAEPDKRWSPDRLCCATELSAAEVAQALTQLELMRNICLTTYFDYALVGGAAAARPARGTGLGRTPQRGARRRRPRRRVERVRL